MDDVNIASKFMTGVLSKIAGTIISKKLGYDINIKLNKISVNVVEGKTHAHLDMDAEVDKDELLRILKETGLY